MGRRTQSNKGKQEGAQWRQRETRPSGKQTHHPTKGNKKGRGDKEHKTLRKADTPSNGKQQRQDPWEGEQTIQELETRRGTMKNKGDKTLGKADTPFKPKRKT